MAPATPAMFPVPRDAARAVQSAWKGDTAPGPLLPFSRRRAVTRSAVPARNTWGKPHRALTTSPAPRISPMAPGPQTTRFTSRSSSHSRSNKTAPCPKV